MNDRKPRADRPTRSQRGRRAERMIIDDLIADPRAFVNSIDVLLDRMTPLHLKACSRPGCIDPVVTVLHDNRTDHVERLCAKHTHVVARALAYEDLRAASERLSRRQRAEFDALEPAMQYALEGR